MFSKLLKSCIFSLSLVYASFTTHASPLYQQYTAFEDSQGNIYLQLPKQFVLIHSDVSIPLSVYPNNGLVKLTEVNGRWQISFLTESEFNALTLNNSDYRVDYLDFDGNGDVEVVLRADSVQDDSFILYGLDNGAVSFSVHNANRDGIDLSQNSSVTFTDINGDGYQDIVYGNGDSLLGNAQKGFVNTARYKTSEVSLIGATGGDFRVAEDGSATYQLPIKMPAGVAGVTPQFAFSYSSNGGDGTLGRGWSLSGLMSVSRCPKNYAQDGFIAGVALDKSDAYCYNGQRLILTSGTHGNVGAKYHTELADFSIIEITKANSNGATGFKVETKSGDTHYYGDNDKHSSANAIVGSSIAPSAYLIAVTEDVKSNPIKYTYTQANGFDEVNLSKIEWGAGLKPQQEGTPNQLNISYAANPRPKYGYRNGRQYGQTKHVSKVEVSQSGELIRRYNLVWDHGMTEVAGAQSYVAENISRINGIQECLIDGNTERCLTPTSFEWKVQQTGSYSRQICEEWDYELIGGINSREEERSCLVWGTETVNENFKAFGSTETISLTVVRNALRDANASFPADINGDGLIDLYYAKDGRWNAYIANMSSANKLSFSYKSIQYYDGEENYAQVVDVNGDGLFELVYPEGGKLYQLSPTSSGVINRSILAYYTGDNYKNFVLLDVNGDSYIDVVQKSDTGLSVRYNQAGTITGAWSRLVSNGMAANSLATATQVHIQTPQLKNTAFLDLNGDGISDLISAGRITNYLCQSRPLGGGGGGGGGQQPLHNKLGAQTDSFGSWHTAYRSTSEALAREHCRQLIGVDTRVITSSVASTLVLQGKVTSGGSPDYSNVYQLDFLKDIDLERDIRVGDFNGDGLSDIIYRKNNVWNLALSKGNGQFQFDRISNSVLNGDNQSRYPYHRFMDVNGDGLTDLLAYQGSSFKVYLSQARLNNIPTFTERLFIDVNVSDDKFLHFADFDGDTKLDVLYEKGDNVHYKLAYKPKERLNVVNLITSGFGQTTEIHYGLLQEGDNRLRKGSSYFDSLTAKRETRNKDYDAFFKSDFVQPNTGLWVVSQVSNIGYNSFSNNTKAVSIGYKYSGMLLHKLGRGSLGFEQLETTDNTTGIKTLTKYSQQYPYVGMPKSTIQKYDGKTLSTATNTFNKVVDAKTGTFPYIEKATDKKYRLLSDNTVNFDMHTSLFSKYDNYGNLTNSTQTTYANSGEDNYLSKVVTKNTYAGDYAGPGSGEKKGRLSESIVTHQLGESGEDATLTSTRKSTFGYNVDGMLEWSKIHGINQKTTYTYNTTGNKTQVCVTDTNTNEERCSTTKWSPDNRFVTSSSNALKQSEGYLYNGKKDGTDGRIWSKTTTGPNGIATTQYFDLQGQLIKEQRADGTQTTIVRAYASNTNKGNCTANTNKVCFSETVTSSGKPTVVTWYDAYGRKVKTQTKAFDGVKWQSQYLAYDELSRNKASYEPYYESNVSGVRPVSNNNRTLFSYDVLGRVTDETLPDGAINKRRYFHRENRYFDGNNNMRVEKLNALGQVVQIVTPSHNVTRPDGDGFEVVDAQTYTDYAYDEYGKLTRVDNYAVNTSASKTSIHTIYDKHGRKKQMYDSDKGHWTYEYNAFGELVEQTSANGTVSKHYYDVLGRKVKSTEQLLGSYTPTVQCFHYGNSKEAKNVGKLIKQQQFATTEHFTLTNNALDGFSCQSTVTPAWQQTVSFDHLGRVASTTTSFEGKTFTQSQTYDVYSRVRTQQLPEGLVVTTDYQNGYLKRVKHGSTLLREVVETDAAGRVTKENIGSGIKKQMGHDNLGRVTSIDLKNQGGQIIHTLAYDYDDVGNLKWRTHNYVNSAYFKEDFTYDSLNRVTKREVDYRYITEAQAGATFTYDQHYGYDFIGNIVRKYSQTDFNTSTDYYRYQYSWGNHDQQVSTHPIRRKQLRSITKNNANYRSYSYDQNGNVINDGSRVFNYTPFDKPWKITSGNQNTEFKYANRSRYMRIDNIQEQNSSGVNYSGLTNYKTYYVGAYKRIERTGGAGSQIEHKYQIAGAVLTRKEGESSFKTLFAHTDYQGSVITVTDQAGQVAEQFIFDPWGKKTKVVISPQVGALVADLTRGTATTRGYTGHEGIDHFDLIHMNGRVYDAEIGRFLQADPHIQAPTNSQNYNRYSYVLNNPMSYTDPSGYFFKKLFKAVGKLWQATTGALLRAIAKVPILNVIAQGVACTVGQAIGCALYSFASTYAVTGSLGGAFRAGAIAYASARIFQEIGDHYSDVGADNVLGAKHGIIDGNTLHEFGGNWLTSGQIAGQITAHAVTGGVIAKATGGKFGHGFFAAGVTKGLGTPLNDTFNQGVISGTITSAIIGGTASVISGGKFVNGASTAAMQSLFNHYSQHEKNSGDLKKSIRDGHITLEEANMHYREGQGADVFADLSKIDLSGITIADFGGKTVKSFNLLDPKYFSSLNDGLVYGSITLRLHPGGAVTANFDIYDFDIHGGYSNYFSRPVRNPLTTLGNIHAGPGTPFKIRFYGQGSLGP